MKENKQEKNENVIVVDGPLPPPPKVKEMPSFYQYFEVTTKLTIVQ